ncbi:MAG: hypothetical protein GY856_06210, partial [bacterium]|nr:hypothetical protein [bacterium]
MLGNTLFYGDNIEILRRYVAAGSVDLVYLDPPFNSNQDYNVLFAHANGTQSGAPNVDTDGDTLIDGFEELIGTNPRLSDTDCDGLGDGAEVAVYNQAQQ